MIDGIIKQWIQKAENDFKTGNDEFLTDDPATDMVCFHMQQCVEKYLKAYLVFYSKEFRKTHNIAELFDLCKDIDSEFEKLYEINAHELTIYVVEIRYPDDFYMPTRDETKECIQIATDVKKFITEKLPKK